MKKIILTILAIAPLFLAGQKIKTIKNPVGWSYIIPAKTPLDENLKTYRSEVQNNLPSIRYSEWKSEVQETDDVKIAMLYNMASGDTIRAWSSKYLAFKVYPYRELESDTDLLISFSEDTVIIDNIPDEIDFSDNKSIIGELNASARLSVKAGNGDVLLDERVTIFFDEEESNNFLRLNHFILSGSLFDPSLKKSLERAGDIEEKRRAIEVKMARYESEILEALFIESQATLRDYFLGNNIDAYGAIFGIKDKSFGDFNETSENVAASIRSLKAFSRKKRQTVEQISPVLESAIATWKSKLTESDNPEIKKILYANLSTASLVLGNLDDAKSYLKQVPESQEFNKGMMVTGSFKYYIKGISDAIKVKERYQETATIGI